MRHGTGRPLPPRVAVAVIAVTFAVVVSSCGSIPSAPTAHPRGEASPSTTTTSVAAPTTTSAPPVPGSPWSTPLTVAKGHALIASSCPSTQFCVVLDDAGNAYDFAGYWSGAQPLGLGSPPAGKAYVSCAGQGFCLATTGNPQTAMWNGSSWGPPQNVGAPARLQALACATPNFCTSVDGEGDAFRFNGSHWSGTSGAWGGPTGSSCPDPGFCVATEGGGTAVWNGSSWSQPQDQDTQGALQSVSCPSSGFCLAGDSSGNVIAWNGSVWSSPQLVDPPGPQAPASLVGVSCVGATFCVGVDNAGHAVAYHSPGGWSAPVRVGSGAALTSVSCASDSFCLATDVAGEVVAFR